MTLLKTPDGAASRRQPVAKLVVIGPAEAGKSTLIAALCQRALNLEVSGRTVAMDHGVLELPGARLSIVGVPGQDRFPTVRSCLIESARYAIWVRRHPWRPDTPTATLLTGTGLPYLVFRNCLAHELDAPCPPWPEPSRPLSIVAGDLHHRTQTGIPALVAELARLLG